MRMIWLALAANVDAAIAVAGVRPHSSLVF